MVGECIIPYGRHSMMNGVSLNGKDANNREAIDSFVAAVNRTNQNIDLVEKHRKVVAEKQFAMLQLTNDAPAIDLLLKSNILELWQMKTGAFFDLLATRTNLPIDRVKSLYEGLMGQ